MALINKLKNNGLMRRILNYSTQCINFIGHIQHLSATLGKAERKILF